MTNVNSVEILEAYHAREKTPLGNTQQSPDSNETSKILHKS